MDPYRPGDEEPPWTSTFEKALSAARSTNETPPELPPAYRTPPFAPRYTPRTREELVADLFGHYKFCPPRRSEA